ncbi:hypothetical protein [Burkholderia vietnamiensis]|uniref:hypothetical protein n=1 Tax=Burkholderia vietnamiensis TaxID=60552 RepID=UPI000A4621DB|nr:hypothetical protein [Burkholderia vietnamiensis]
MSAPIFADVRLDGWTTFRGFDPDNGAVSVRFMLTLGGVLYPVRYFRSESGTVAPEPATSNGMDAVQSAVSALVPGGAVSAVMASLTTELERLSHLANDVAVARANAAPSNGAYHFGTDAQITDPDNAYWTFDRVCAPNLVGEWWEVRELYDDARNVVAMFNAGLVLAHPEDLYSYYHVWMAQ